jgi:rubrerythrin
MATFFTAGEVARAAVEIERRGQSFYKRIAEQAQNDEARKFFAYFAGEEAKHEQLFEELADRLGPVELPAWSTVEEYAQYLGALLDSHALFDGGVAEYRMANADDLQTAVRMAMSFEKDTILFFTEMRDLVPETERPFVQECIEEERTHLRQLRSMLS